MTILFVLSSSIQIFNKQRGILYISQESWDKIVISILSEVNRDSYFNRNRAVVVISFFSFWLCMNLQEMAKLEELLKNIRSKEFREFCASLLSNQIGGLGSRFHINTNLPAQRQTLLELLVHLDSVLLSGNSVLVPLHQIASQPQNVTVRHFLYWVAIYILFMLHAVSYSS